MAMIPTAGVAILQEETEERVVSNEEAVSVENLTENTFQFDDDVDRGDDIFDYQAYQQANQAQVVSNWENLMSKLVNCYFEQLVRLGKHVIATSFVEPFSCKVPYGKTSKVKVYFFDGKNLLIFGTIKVQY